MRSRSVWAPGTTRGPPIISVVEQGLRSGKCEAHSSIDSAKRSPESMETGASHNVLQRGTRCFTNRSNVH